MARPIQPRIQSRLSHSHDISQVKTSFFLGVTGARDTPIAISNKGETALKPNKHNGLAWPYPNWPRLAATVAAS